METHLVVSAIGKERAGFLEELSRAVLECGCTIGESRMAMLGREFALIMLLSGNWNAVAKLESMLPRLEQSLRATLQCKRTESRATTARRVPYAVEIVAVDRPGIVHDVTDFLAKRDITIEDVSTTGYAAPHTGTAMFSLQMTVGIPADAAVATVRGEFMDLCDELNLDAMLAPVK